MHENVTWKSGYRGASKLSANDAYKAVEDIRIANGGELSAGDVVEAARDEGSPLHVVFEWDNDAAAGKYRKEQARGMIRSFCVQRGREEDEPTRVYQCVQIDEEAERVDASNRYWTLEAALEDPGHRVRIIKDLSRQLTTMRSKFHQISELATVWRAVDKVFAKAN